MTTRDPFGEQRARLLEEGVTLPWAAIWQRLAATRAALIGATLGVSDAQAAWRPPRGEGEEAWSIAEVLRHLITATPNITAIIEATAVGATELKDPPGAIAVGDATVDELREQLVAVSEQLLSVGLRIPAEPNNEVTVPHAFFGPLPCRSWPLFQALHDGCTSRRSRASSRRRGTRAEARRLRLRVGGGHLEPDGGGLDAGAEAAVAAERLAVDQDLIRWRAAADRPTNCHRVELDVGGVDGPTGSIGFAGRGGVKGDAEGRSLAVGALRAARQHARSNRREDEREYPRGSGQGGVHAPILRRA